MIHLDERVEKTGAERAVLVAIHNREVPKEKAEEYLAEMKLLVNTAGAATVGVFLQKMDHVHPATYVGKGKLEEVKAYAEEHKADLVVFDDDLSPSQVKNIDRALGVKVLDRSGIILHIFSEHARSAQAKAQVELAQLRYMLPRLAGLWSHLSKQKGGIGMKGAGEKEIDLLKEELKKIDRQNLTQRKGRGEMVRVSLVGYTNAGKSTLMNRIAKSDVLAEDKLFATLDTTVRKVVVDQVPLLLSDTVGFLRKLPHDLVECFKSTLDEVRESDILLHVVDVSHPSFMDHIRVVNETLASIKAGDKATIVVFNKVDRLSAEARKGLEETWFAKENSPAVFISAGQKEGIEGFKEMLLTMVREQYRDKYPHFKFAEKPEWETASEAPLDGMA